MWKKCSLSCFLYAIYDVLGLILLLHSCIWLMEMLQIELLSTTLYTLLSNAGLFLFLFWDVYILELFISTLSICYHVQCLVLFYAAATTQIPKLGLVIVRVSYLILLWGVFFHSKVSYSIKSSYVCQLLYSENHVSLNSVHLIISVILLFPVHSRVFLKETI